MYAYLLSIYVNNFCISDNGVILIGKILRPFFKFNNLSFLSNVGIIEVDNSQ